MDNNTIITIIDKSFIALAESVASILADQQSNGVDKAAAMTKTFEQFGDYLKSNIDEPSEDDINDRNNVNVLQPKLEAMVSALIAANPTLRKEEAMYFLLHSPRGQSVAEHLNSISKKEHPMNRQEEMQEMRKFIKAGGMSAVAKRIIETGSTSLNEHEYTTLVQEDASLRKISFEKAFADQTTQQAYKIIREAGYVTALGPLTKGMATLTPTSTEVGNTNVSDDSAEAVRLLQEMAAKNGRSFESVFADPANRSLAVRTYTAANRPPASSTSGDELQKMAGRDLTPPPTGRDPNWHSSAGR